MLSSDARITEDTLRFDISTANVETTGREYINGTAVFAPVWSNDQRRSHKNLSSSELTSSYLTFFNDPVRRPIPRGTGRSFCASPPDFCLARPWPVVSFRPPSRPVMLLLFAISMFR
jgi:hypothetical protein